MRSFWHAALVLGTLLIAAHLRAVAGEPQRLITAAVDESQLATLGGNTPPASSLRANDQGAVDDQLRFGHLLLLLKRDPQTETRLEQLVAALHDPHSPQFHHWLTSEELGAEFGAHPADVAAIRNWLESQGFTINRVYHNGLIVDFSGTARQIREAFHTEIHNLVLPSGERHVANVSDPRVPAALAPAIAGVPLHDFFPRPRLSRLGQVSLDQNTGKWQPHFNVTFQGSEFHVVGPYDFATIYNLLPLWNEGFTGKGVTIATVEDSNLAHPDDWSTFRRTFGLTGFEQGNFRQV